MIDEYDDDPFVSDSYLRYHEEGPVSRVDAEPCPCGMQQNGKYHQVWCALYQW